VHAGVPIVPDTLDLVLYQQFPTFEFYDFQIIDRGMRLAIVDLFFEGLVLLLEFRKVRLHRHAVCLLNQWRSVSGSPNDLSVTQTRRKGDDTPPAARLQS